jgi:hypothetical protein
MVGLQAMVLGRLGRKPSPHPRACALSSAHRPPFKGRGFRAPAFIMPLAVLFPSLQRGLRFALLCVARDLGSCDHETIEALVGFCSPILLRPGFFLCTPGPQPLILYIRNIIPDNMSIPRRRSWTYRGGAEGRLRNGHLGKDISVATFGRSSLSFPF